MAAENLVRRPSDAVAGAVIAVFGAVYAIIALQTPPDPSFASVIGPAVMPTLLGSLLAAGGVALVVTGLRLRPAEADADAEPAPRADRRKLWITIGIFGVYVLAFIPVGYLLSTAAFLIGLSTYFSPKTWKSNVIYGVVFAGAVFVLFEYMLRVPLPEGLLSGVL